MKCFVDSADPAAIRELADTGLVDGVTTNPTFICPFVGRLDDLNIDGLETFFTD